MISRVFPLVLILLNIVYSVVGDEIHSKSIDTLNLSFSNINEANTNDIPEAVEAVDGVEDVFDPSCIESKSCIDSQMDSSVGAVSMDISNIDKTSADFTGDRSLDFIDLDSDRSSDLVDLKDEQIGGSSSTGGSVDSLSFGEGAGLLGDDSDKNSNMGSDDGLQSDEQVNMEDRIVTYGFGGGPVAPPSITSTVAPIVTTSEAAT
ncbi:mucin-like secreted protein, partial [Cryptosporidium canis]